MSELPQLSVVSKELDSSFATAGAEACAADTRVNQASHACKAGEKGNVILWTGEQEAGAQGLSRGPYKAKHCRDVLHSEPGESPSLPVQARCLNLATKLLPRDRRFKPQKFARRVPAGEACAGIGVHSTRSRS